MPRVLLSIKPKYVDEIFNGTKRFEYRKVKFTKKDIDKILIYCTSPIMKVVGEAKIEEIIEGIPSTVWEITKDYAGISKEQFDRYYKGRGKAVAYRLGNVEKYSEPVDLKIFGLKAAPQSFAYIDF